MRIGIGLALLALLAFAGCGSATRTSSTTAAPGSAAPSATAPGATPNPNAKEVSPSGDIPDGVTWVKHTLADYSIEVPEGWSQSQSGGAVVFTDKLNAVRVETSKAPAGTPAGVKVTRRGGAAYLVKSAAKSTPDPVTGKTVSQAIERYVFLHNGSRAIITLSSPKGADNVDPWKHVTDSFTWLR